jgi:hypothetical protein
MKETFPPAGYVRAESKVDRIEVFMPAPVQTKEHKNVVDFTCPQCGARTAYSAVEGGLTCVHCGYYEAPKMEIVGKGATQFEFTVETIERAAQGWGQVRKEMICQHCGAHASLPVDSLTHSCVFCGSNKVIQHKAPQDLLRPRFLVPFSIDAKACVGIARQWLGNSWMTPRGLHSMADVDGFTGIYLPFWTFDSLMNANWKAEVGHTKTERYYQDGEWKTRTVIEWRWENGHVRMPIDDLLVQGTERLSAILLDQIKTYDLRQLAPYEPKYLAGFQAHSYDVSLEKAWEIGRQQMRDHARQGCINQASTSRVRNFSMSLDFSEESWRYILLPLYMANYRYGSQSYQVMVNGQTGAIAGQRPVDWTRIWFVVAALLAPGLLIGLVGLVTLIVGGVGLAIGGFGFVLLVIGLVIAGIIINQAMKMDDA